MPVIQLTLDGEVVRTYPSTLAASKVIAPDEVGGGTVQAIRKCVRGIRPTAVGFKWQLVTYDADLDWRGVPGCEDYFVSSTGVVRHGVKVLNQKMSAQGYWKVHVCRTGKMEYAMVHRLVAEAFLIKPEDTTIVDHLDGNKTHNAAANLEWCTPAENVRRAVATGLFKTARPVIASNADGEETRYPSSGVAGKALGIPGISIWRLCKGLTTWNKRGLRSDTSERSQQMTEKPGEKPVPDSPGLPRWFATRRHPVSSEMSQLWCVWPKAARTRGGRSRCPKSEQNALPMAL